MVSAGRLLQKGFSSKVVTQNQSFWWNESHHFMQQVRSHEYRYRHHERYYSASLLADCAINAIFLSFNLARPYGETIIMFRRKKNLRRLPGAREGEGERQGVEHLEPWVSSHWSSCLT